MRRFRRRTAVQNILRKEVKAMAEINCTVTSCIHQNDDKCRLSVIRVEPCPHSNTRDPKETDCMSYRPRA